MGKDAHSKSVRWFKAFVLGEWHTLEELDWAMQGGAWAHKYLLTPVDRALQTYFALRDEITRRRH